jgi:hypothetical protein
LLCRIIKKNLTKWNVRLLTNLRPFSLAFPLRVCLF